MFYGHYKVKLHGLSTIMVWESNKRLKITEDEQVSNNLLLDPNFKVFEIIPLTDKMVIN